MSASKVVLVTGCSSGVGLSLAVQLARSGHRVYASLRDVSKSAELKAASEAAGVAVEIIALDVTEDKSVEDGVASVLQKEGKIDILVNNAGAALFRPTEQASMKEIQQCFETNFFGSVRVTKAVLPHMRKAKSGRIINVSSVGGLIGQPFNDIYCAAKFALDGWSESLAATLIDYNVHVVVVNPGGISSAFAQNAMKVLAHGGGPVQNEDYKPTFDAYMKNRTERIKTPGIFQTSEQVASVIQEAIEAPKPHFRYITSEWARRFVALKVADDEDGDKLIAKTRSEVLGL